MPTGPSHGQDITTLRGRSGIISNTPSEPEEGLEYLEEVLEKVATPPWPWRAVLVFSSEVGAVGDSAESEGAGVFGVVVIGRGWRSSRPDEVCRRARSAVDVISASRAGMMSNLGLQVRHGCLDNSGYPPRSWWMWNQDVDRCLDEGPGGRCRFDRRDEQK